MVCADAAPPSVTKPPVLPGKVQWTLVEVDDKKLLLCTVRGEGDELVCLVDDAEDCTRDEASFLWTVFTRMEPASDIHAAETSLRRFHLVLSSPLVLDCRIKPWYPPVLEPLPETVKRVDALWPKIFPGNHFA